MTGGAGVERDAPATGVLVIGLGNPLREDDGVGHVVAAALAGDPRLAGADIRTVHQLLPELAHDVARAGLVVLVDAAAGALPGSLAVRWLPERGDAGGGGGPGRGAGAVGDAGAIGGAMSHHLDPDGLAGLAAALWGSVPPIAVVEVGAASLGVGEGLTAGVRAAVPRAVDVVAALARGPRRA